jgi:hypothetical protein
MNTSLVVNVFTNCAIERMPFGRAAFKTSACIYNYN